jgi:hypothetical protein
MGLLLPVVLGEIIHGCAHSSELTHYGVTRPNVLLLIRAVLAAPGRLHQAQSSQAPG